MDCAAVLSGKKNMIKFYIINVMVDQILNMKGLRLESGERKMWSGQPFFWLSLLTFIEKHAPKKLVPVVHAQ